MKTQLETRLAELKAEYEAGLKMRIELERKRVTLDATLMRIAGAIQVVEELLNPDLEEQPPGD